MDELKTLFREIAGQPHNDIPRHSALDAESPEQQNIDLGSLQTFGYGSQKIYFDLGDYIQKLSPGRYTEFQAALNNCIIYKAHTDSYYSAGTGTLQVIRSFGGLSVYVPQTRYTEN